MFESIQIKNFQSIKDLSVDLKPFTVIVGATDSGKSAFFRAISTLISNKRGADFITHGEKRCTITGQFSQGTLTLQRGKATADNFYEVTKDGATEKYTKLSGTTPEEVSAFLGIASKDPINLASQFDKPYLLDSKEYGPSETARILGALTNVNVIFEAARESNRQKTQAASTLKIRQADLENNKTKLEAYSRLEEEQVKLSHVEELIKQAEQYESTLNDLTSLMKSIELAQTRLDNVSESLQEVNIDFEQADKMITMRAELTKLLQRLEQVSASIERKQADEVKYKLETETLEKKYTETLRKAGTCPTCNQSTKDCTD